jgi:hypothetical protein
LDRIGTCDRGVGRSFVVPDKDSGSVFAQRPIGSTRRRYSSPLRSVSIPGHLAVYRYSRLERGVSGEEQGWEPPWFEEETEEADHRQRDDYALRESLSDDIAVNEEIQELGQALAEKNRVYPMAP